jgi:small subunit ribosomal protein S1
VSAKGAQENPWSNIEAKYPTNSMVSGRVIRIVDFGAFVELAPGVEGLVHISELSDRRVKTVGEVVKEGQETQFRVLKIDPEAQRISLSLKPPPKERPAAVDDRLGKAKSARKRPLRGGLASHFDW